MISRRALFIAVPLLWLAALGSAAGAIYCKHRARTLFIELEVLNGRRDNLEIEWGQLQLDYPTDTAVADDRREPEVVSFACPNQNAEDHQPPTSDELRALVPQ